jgi:uncharacterized protein YjbJ (UPF0337 family)
LRDITGPSTKTRRALTASALRARFDGDLSGYRGQIETERRGILRNKDEAKGRIKQSAGEATASDRLKNRGRIDRVAGRAKRAVDALSDKVKGKS